MFTSRPRLWAPLTGTGLVLFTALTLAAPPAVADPSASTDPSVVSRGGVATATGSSATPAPTTGTPTAAPSTAAGAPDATSSPVAAEPDTSSAAVASATPLPTTQVDGVVWAQTTVGNTVYAVGSFTKARPAGAAPGTQETPRANILAYDIRTGVLSTTFVHTLNAQAKAVVASADGSRVYIGGQFTSVDGQARSRIAAFSTATGALLPYAPKPNYTVEAIAATSSTVYFGGAFATVGGVSRTRLAATDTAGTLLPWAPTAAGTVRGLVAVPASSRVYVAGSFSVLNGAVSHGVNAVEATTGATVTVPVATDIYATDQNSNGAGVYALRSDGVRIYGGGYHYLASSVARFEGTFAMDPASGKTLWVNDCWGDTYDTAPVAGTLYVASHAHDCRAAGFFTDTGQHYFGLAYGELASSHHNVRDGRGWDYSRFPTSTLTSWRPRFAPGSVTHQSVWSFTGNSAFVAAGGEFPSVSGVASQGLVRFRVS